MYNTEGREVANVAVLVDGEMLNNITHINVQYRGKGGSHCRCVSWQGDVEGVEVDLILMKIKKT
jgi:hypothetical protein